MASSTSVKTSSPLAQLHQRHRPVAQRAQVAHLLASQQEAHRGPAKSLGRFLEAALTQEHHAL
jgi:hypothetical protein